MHIEKGFSLLAVEVLKVRYCRLSTKIWLLGLDLDTEIEGGGCTISVSRVMLPNLRS